jgi:hypothetical protein
VSLYYPDTALRFLCFDWQSFGRRWSQLSSKLTSAKP